MIIYIYKILKVKIEKKTIKFEDIEIERKKFHQHERPISIKNIFFDKR